jgi:hypothetical protein
MCQANSVQPSFRCRAKAVQDSTKDFEKGAALPHIKRTSNTHQTHMKRTQRVL